MKIGGIHISGSSLIGIAILLVATWVFDPFEFAVDQFYKAWGILGCGLAILTYGIVGLVRGKYPRGGSFASPSLDGDRTLFWFYAIHANVIGLVGTIFGLYEIGVFGS